MRRDAIKLSFIINRQARQIGEARLLLCEMVEGIKAGGLSINSDAASRLRVQAARAERWLKENG